MGMLWVCGSVVCACCACVRATACWLWKKQNDSTLNDSTPSVIVRINCPNRSPYEMEDLKVLQDIKNIDAILVPKADSANSVKVVTEKVQLPIWCMIETPKGVQNVDQLAQKAEMECLVFGSNDLTKDIKAVLSPLTRHPLLYSMSKTIIAARAENKFVVDGVFMSLSAGSETKLEHVCVHGKELGFDGKSLIHPKQIEITNRIFSPTKSEVEVANNIIEVFAAATTAGKGVCLIN